MSRTSQSQGCRHTTPFLPPKAFLFLFLSLSHKFDVLIFWKANLKIFSIEFTVVESYQSIYCLSQGLHLDQNCLRVAAQDHMFGYSADFLKQLYINDWVFIRRKVTKMEDLGWLCDILEVLCANFSVSVALLIGEILVKLVVFLALRGYLGFWEGYQKNLVSEGTVVEIFLGQRSLVTLLELDQSILRVLVKYFDFHYISIHAK